MEEEIEEGAIEVSRGELLLEDVYWVFEEESRREATSGVRE